MIAALWATMAGAHPLAPAALEVEVIDANHVEVVFREPTRRPVGTELTPWVGERCKVTPGPSVVDNAWVTQSRHVYCDDGLAEVLVGVEGLDAAPVDVVLTVHHDELVSRHLLTAQTPAVPLFATETPWSAFLGFGVLHLLEGLDHGLLIVGLTWLIGFTRRLVWTLSAFTLGHSLTLAIVATGRGGPIAIVELLIALSLVWLAMELVREDEAPGRGWLVRHPESLAAGLGLVHGAGFGGALAELGLPRTEVLASVIAFNGGIELGQIAIVAAFGLLSYALGIRVERSRMAVAYLIGGLAMAMTMQRIFTLVWPY
ncbi:MAG: HupE/UreJ family protein [Myxococcota bacterium]